MKEYIIVSSDNTIYSFERFTKSKDNDWILRRSNLDKGWTKPGSKCVHLKDSGNDVQIKIEDQKFKTIRYNNLCELYIVLREYFEEKPEARINWNIYKKEK